MSTWDDDVFDQHPVWGRVDELAGLLTEERLPSDIDAPQRLSVVRLKTALELLREHRERGVKAHYIASMLDNVHNQLTNAVLSPLTTFVENPDDYGDYVNDAALQAESVFAYVAQWPSLPAAGQAAAAGRAFAEYKREAELALQNFADQNAELKAKNEALQSGFGNVERLMDGVQEKYEASLQERENEYIEAINRVDDSGKEAYDKAIDEALEARIETLVGLEEDARQHVAGTLEAKKSAEALEAASKNAADWLSKRAFAKDFGEQARRKAAAGWVYDVLGAAAIGTPLILLLVHFLRVESTDGTVALSMTRLSIIVGAVVLGGYFFSRGATNHRQARASKSAEIRLNTFEAFITHLTPQEQADIRLGMAKSIYLHGRLSDEEPDAPNPILRVLDRIKGKDDDDATDKPA